MQCPSCQFENMPGSGRCARCGGFLALATAAIDVNPPRATRLSRRMPRLWGRFWSLRRTWANIQTSLTQPIQQLFSRFENTDFRLGTIVRTIVPGWAQRFRGNNPRAIVFFVSYLALLLPALLFLGTGLGSILLGLAFGMHVAATSRRPRRPIREVGRSTDLHVRLRRDPRPRVVLPDRSARRARCDSVQLTRFDRTVPGRRCVVV